MKKEVLNVTSPADDLEWTCNVGPNHNSNDDLGWLCRVDQLLVHWDDDSEQGDDLDSSSNGMEESSDEGLKFVEKIAHEDIVYDINHDLDEDSDAIDSWAQDDNESISMG